MYTLIGGGICQNIFEIQLIALNTQTHILLKNRMAKCKSKVEEYRLMIPILRLRVNETFLRVFRY